MGFLAIIGFIWFIIQVCKEVVENWEYRERMRQSGFDVYRGVDGKLHHTSNGKKLNVDEIRDYFK